MQEASLDSFKCRRTLEAGGKAYAYYDLKLAEQNGLAGIGALPFSLKVLLENLLRHEDGFRAVKGVGLSVAASPRAAGADFAVDGPAEVEALLRQVEAALRAGSVPP